MDAADPLRDKLLEAAARVFAARGYAGTKVQDIVREAGLSAGAMYGRFASKNELLTAAIVEATARTSDDVREGQTVADLLAETAERRHGSLDDREAMRLEAYVTARREPEVAAAIRAANLRRREISEPLIARALEDGTITEASDLGSILYYLDTMTLGLIVQRAAGIEPPDIERWDTFIRHVMNALGQMAEDDPPSPRL